MTEHSIPTCGRTRSVCTSSATGSNAGFKTVVTPETRPVGITERGIVVHAGLVPGTPRGRCGALVRRLRGVLVCAELEARDGRR